MTEDVLPAGAQAIITVNYGSNQAGTGGGNPAEAADWVRYANLDKGWNIHYWEIGNEIGGNGYFGPDGKRIFTRRWGAFAKGTRCCLNPHMEKMRWTSFAL